MAQTKQTIYKTFNETHYSVNDGSMVTWFATNGVYDFTPIMAPNGGANDGSYAINRVIRVLANEVATPMAKTTSNDLAALDQLSDVKWETITTKTGKLRSIGIKLGMNEVFDIDSVGTTHMKMLNLSQLNTMQQRVEDIIAELRLTKGTAAAANIVIGSSDKLVEKFTSAFQQIELYADEYKYMSDDMACFINPIFADKIAIEAGKEWKELTNFFGDGTGKAFTVLGRKYAKIKAINTVNGTTAKDGAAADGKRLAGIVADREALCMLSSLYAENLDTKISLTRYVGDFHYDIIKGIDKNRIVFIWADETVAVSKEVNAA